MTPAAGDPSIPLPPSTRIGAVALVITLEAALVVSWSAGFIGIRFATEHAPIFLTLLWRSLVSGLVLLPFVAASWSKLSWREVASEALFGLVAMAGYLAGFSLAIAYGVPTGLVALMTDMLPLAVAVLSWPFLGQGLSARQWLGTGLGLTGVLIASGWTHGSGGAPVWAYGLPVLGTLALAAGTLLRQRRPLSAMSVPQSLCIQCLAASAAFAVLAWQEGTVRPVLEPGFLGGIAWLVVVATFAAWGLYYAALRRSSPTRVTAVLYLSPPVTMVWAWVMFGEPLSWSMAAGLVVSLAGVVMVSSTNADQAARGRTVPNSLGAHPHADR